MISPPVNRLARAFFMFWAGLPFLAPTFSNAQSQQTLDVTTCHSGEVTTVFADKDVTLRSAEGWGIVMSQGNTSLDNSSFHVVTTLRTHGQAITETGYVELTDPDGDVILMESSRTSTEHTSRFFHGTGKWSGISGSGKGQYIVFRRMQPDWAAACSKSVWTIELPAK